MSKTPMEIAWEEFQKEYPPVRGHGPTNAFVFAWDRAIKEERTKISASIKQIHDWYSRAGEQE